MAESRAGEPSNLSGLFQPLLGGPGVIDDPVERRVHSRDIFFWDDAQVADLILRPASPRSLRRPPPQASPSMPGAVVCPTPWGTCQYGAPPSFST